ncbi:ATP-binding protein [Streptomyces antimycoticus]|uniref:ATP-binding protein n=1 Tax=Streptomyces antimycoticus TaxID=68175 RepID=UPI00341EC5AA
MEMTSVRLSEASNCTVATGRSELLSRPLGQDGMTVCFPIRLRRVRGHIPVEDARRVRDMRRLARARLCLCDLDDMADDVELIVSELITNAIQHSHGTQVTMTLRLVSEVLRLTVRDDTRRRPRIQRPRDEAENGRGLFLVRQIAEQHWGSWGISPDGTITWCALPIRRR